MVTRGICGALHSSTRVHGIAFGLAIFALEAVAFGARVGGGAHIDEILSMAMRATG